MQRKNFVILVSTAKEIRSVVTYMLDTKVDSGVVLLIYLREWLSGS